MNWESIDQKYSGYLYRAPIFGGWLVKEVHDVSTILPDWSANIPGIRNEQGYEFRSSITFVPDPNHEWDLNKEYGIKLSKTS
jgi:hypothetical protein